MARRHFRYYVGREGPQNFFSDTGELPFRVEEISHVHAPQIAPPTNVALNIVSGIAGIAGQANISPTVAAADIAAFRAAHFYAFHLAAELL